jgi:hypothetical protein
VHDALDEIDVSPVDVRDDGAIALAKGPQQLGPSEEEGHADRPRILSA